MTPSNTKEHLIQNLLGEVEKRFALQATPNLVTKITNVFNRLPEEALVEWVDMLSKLPSTHSEWQGFIEGLTVHETYFCRDNQLFEAIKKTIIPKICANKTSPNLTIWSAGCSTGEEVYNLAIAALEALNFLATGCCEIVTESLANKLNGPLTVVGTDLSKQVLRIAEIGIYNDSVMGPFRGNYRHILPYFIKESIDTGSPDMTLNAYRVQEYVRKTTRFQLMNLLTAQFEDMQFDLIVCRNVLIYFNEDRTRAVQEIFNHHLTKNGVLVLGAVDPLLLKNYTPINGHGQLWYEKNGA